MRRTAALLATLLVGTAVCANLVPPQPAHADSRPLFGPAPDDPGTLGSPEPWELRRHVVTVDWDLLYPLCHRDADDRPDTLTLNLFPDVTVTAEANEIAHTDRTDGIRWLGDAVDQPHSHVTLNAVSLCDGNPKTNSLAGTIRLGGDFYTIEPRSHDRAVITEVDQQAIGLVQKPDHPKVDAHRAATPGDERAATPQEPSVIDALILYTPGAVDQAGGADAIESWITDAVSRANDALHDSDVNARFRVVDMEQAKDYSGRETVEPAFKHLSSSGDAFHKQAAKLRERYGADVVTTIVKGYDPDTGVGGLASYPENPRAPDTDQDVWSVVAANQLWAPLLAHEWGHLLGQDHDWRTSPEKNPYYPDNHGYLPPDSRFVTIMGYPSSCSRPCQYADYYANPAQTYNGEKLGVPMGRPQPSNNTRVMNITAPQVAAYRTARTGGEQYDLGTSVEPPGSGVVDTGSSGPYDAGSQITAEARPKDGYDFAGWTLDGRAVSTQTTLSVPMDRDHKVVARFSQQGGSQYGLFTDPATGGTVRLNPPGGLYTAGNQVLATAQARPHYEFLGWLLDGHPAGDDPMLTITPSQDHHLAARFVPERRELTIRPSPGYGGRVTTSAPPDASGLDIVARAFAARGYVFKRWQLDGRPYGTAPIASLTITGRQTLTAVFGKAPKHKKKKPKKHKKHKKKRHH